MQARVLHTVLAFLVLLQPLFAVAMVSADPAPAREAMQSSMNNCHDAVAPATSTPVHVEGAMDCCDGGRCYMNCVSVLLTVSPAYSTGSTSFHPVQIPGMGYTAHTTSLAELFRPPRIS
jgi:hypothetical protein